MSSENRGQTGLGYVESRLRKTIVNPTGSPFFGSCLVAWGDGCDRRLRGSGIEGKYVVLNM